MRTPKRLPILSAGLLLAASVVVLRHHKPVRGTAFTPTAAPSVWAVGVAERAGGQKMPAKPFEGQAKPPCKGSQVAIAGGCWYRVTPDRKELPEGARCTAELYEHEGSCYLPVKAIPPALISEP